MPGLYEINEAGWGVPDYTRLNTEPTEVVIRNDGVPQGRRADENVDTSSILAEDARGEAESVQTVAGGGNQKPPFDLPPSGHTTFEDPEEGDNEAELGDSVATLESVATGLEAGAAESQASERLELITRGDGSSVLINRGHSRPDLLEKVTTHLENNEPWVRASIDTSRQREYFVDNPSDPTLFAKVTDQTDEPDGASELAQAAEVKSLVGSNQAQEIAQKYGFASISYVEPLAVVDEPDSQTIVYPWQDGTHPINNETLSVSEQTAQLEVLHDVAQNLRGFMGANGIDPSDLDSFQMLIDGDNNLCLIDAEDFKPFEPADPILMPGEVVYVPGDVMSDAVDDEGFDFVDAYTSTFEPADTAPFDEHELQNHSLPGTRPGHAEIFPGDFVLGRQNADGTGVEIATTTNDGYAVAIWNTHTGESGFFSVRNPDEARAQIVTLIDIEEFPSLTGPETVAHLIGPTRVDEVDGIRHSFAPDLERALGTDEYVTHISSSHSQLSMVDSRGGSTVVFNTGTGGIEVFSETGQRTYSFQPPKAVSRQTE